MTTATPGYDTDTAINKLREALGLEACGEALSLTSKLFRNIVEQPAETKFRKLNPQNPKLQAGLFRHGGIAKLFAAAGFVKTEDGSLELPQNQTTFFLNVNSVIQRQMQQQRMLEEAAQTSAGSSKVVDAYRAACEGGAKGAGLAELAALAANNREAVDLLEKILSNIRRYPDNKKYQSVNLTKAVGQKVLPALPLMTMAGFVRKQVGGEDQLELPFVDRDLIERLWAMIYWATRPKPATPLQPSSRRISQALGAVIGAVVGDALGSPLAGKREYSVSAKEIDKVLEMGGGGIWCLAPGQASDNTEMVLCLADALVAARSGGGAADHFPLEDIAVRYGKWGQTVPFHTESANGQVFRGALSADQTMEKAKKMNEKAIGNGALVRCPVLAAFTTSQGSAAAAADIARKDASLSHPNIAVGEANAGYTVLLRSLIMLNGDRSAAIAELKEWVERELAAREKSINTSLAQPKPKAGRAANQAASSGGGYKKEEEFVAPGTSLVAFKELASWIALAFDDAELPFLEDRNPSSARVAFTHALRHVKLGSSFEQAMRATLAGGGDCPANAAIVGGLVGAMVGLEGIPARWVQAVLTSDTAQGQQRPTEYHPGRLPELVDKIVGA